MSQKQFNKLTSISQFNGLEFETLKDLENAVVQFLGGVDFIKSHLEIGKLHVQTDGYLFIFDYSIHPKLGHLKISKAFQVIQVRGINIFIENKTKTVKDEHFAVFAKMYAQAFLSTEKVKYSDYIFDPIIFLKIATLDFLLKENETTLSLWACINNREPNQHLFMNKNKAHCIQLDTDAASEAHCDFFRNLHEFLNNATGLQVFEILHELFTITANETK